MRMGMMVPTLLGAGTFARHEFVTKPAVAVTATLR
jgi:hypothetical protein